ncbi:MAG: 50S ribosomal protein L17 [Firmicutes bacterium]|nr:50S ribosomal protein L17 [Candidatus Fermentithermobacillaceae bacterium]
MSYSKFDRPSGQRRALLRALVTSLLDKERIVTTHAKAKEAQALAEKMITLAKQDSLAARRRALAFLTSETVAKKLFDTLGPRYAHRTGGYSRVTLIGPRRGDGAPMAMIELIR